MAKDSTKKAKTNSTTTLKSSAKKSSKSTVNSTSKPSSKATKQSEKIEKKLARRGAKKSSRSENKKPSIDDKIKDYFVGAFAELRKVKWPSRKLTWNLTFAVIVFVGFFGLYTTLIDYGVLRSLEILVLGKK